MIVSSLNEKIVDQKFNKLLLSNFKYHTNLSYKIYHLNRKSFFCHGMSLFAA